MSKRESCISALLAENNWIEYLHNNSGLPGKRGNLELLHACVEVCDEAFFLNCLEYDPVNYPTNTPGEFIAMCGTAGLGKLVCEDKENYFSALKTLASDPRWRVREGVAFALQYIGLRNFSLLITHMQKWKTDHPLVQRAVVAGLCEPALLKQPENAETVLDIINTICVSLTKIEGRKNESFRVLKKGLAYGVSVAVVSLPEKGIPMFESLLNIEDKDLRWILKENLMKNRLVRMDSAWVQAMSSKIISM